MRHNCYRSILLLNNGTKYYGWSYSNSILSIGEIVFNTGITGYQEIMTDPSYAGQIVIFTYPEIGNTGINQEDNESSNIHVKGIITKNICEKPSNWRHQISFVNYLKEQKIPHIFGIDTRALTKQLRKQGVMNACISSKDLREVSLKKQMNDLSKIQTTNLIDMVTTKRPYIAEASNFFYTMYSYLNYKTYTKYNQELKIVVIDFGVKNNILSRLVHYGCNITVVPAYSTYHTINQLGPNGILLSNGPGDPSSMHNIIKNIANIIHFFNIPIFGICMGHQILSLALKSKTFKLKFGHRGLNHPTGIEKKVEITSQNHGFAVDLSTIYHDNLVITHMNLNDSTVAGLIHKNKPIFSVQYHPEASPGPHDSDYLFHGFIELIKIHNKHSIESTKHD
uniref:Carbamoyl phosphate synthase small chain n=1 Tax=Eucheuma denticulatum TaxID=305493 RepID=A0A8E7PH04_9FLOR|nr:carbamoyl phosphate synthase small subunit [Eucheuma denticulatum]